MLQDSSKQLLKVAKKYYLLGMNQEEIAKSENLSKSTVSRLINKAIKLGFVTFNLNFPSISADNLEEKLQEIFHLKHVFVAEVDVDDEKVIMHDVAKSVARYLNSVIENNDIIGVSWG
ncbi:winged helix-turn-helix transcriptional regulator, partial [Bacillaceae bacterium Marseille-Q3522]|nr:winged helix-turn-helix transcriptional regulator [Bacillaceae bacterium Marseille-Q3522]